MPSNLEGSNSLKASTLATLLAGIVTVVGFAAGAAAAGAKSGTASGGGGTLIEAAFRTEGYGIITKISQNLAANSYCSAPTLEKALDTAEVKPVDQLVDPRTGKVISDKEAWTVPGKIQLLKSSWKNFVSAWTPLTIGGRSVGALIIHEIYRATGTCNDDHFRITDRVWQLINGGDVVHKPFSESFTFNYAYVVGVSTDCSTDCEQVNNIVPADTTTVNSGDIDASDFLVCDRRLDLGESATCMVVDLFSGEIAAESKVSIATVQASAQTTTQNVNSKIGRDDREQLGVVMDNPFIGNDFQNQILFISEKHPYLLIHDIRQGTWYGSIQ